MKNTFKKAVLIDEVKAYCNHELNTIDRFHCDPNATTSRCYGAVMFLVHACDAYDELGPWWNDEMHPRFREKGAY